MAPTRPGGRKDPTAKALDAKVARTRAVAAMVTRRLHTCSTASGDELSSTVYSILIVHKYTLVSPSFDQQSSFNSTKMC